MNYYLIKFKATDPDRFIRNYERLVKADSLEKAIEKLNKIWANGISDVENKTIE